MVNLRNARLGLLKVPEGSFRPWRSHVSVVVIVVELKELMQARRDLILIQEEIRKHATIELRGFGAGAI
jgi:hypothetical protein